MAKLKSNRKGKAEGKAKGKAKGKAESTTSPRRSLEASHKADSSTSGGTSGSTVISGTPRSSSSKKAASAAAKAGKDPTAIEPAPKPSAVPLAAAGAAATTSSAAAVSSANAPAEKKKADGGPLGPNAKKVEYLSEELLARRPLEAKAHEALAKKAGPPKQEVHFERKENHRPIGRADELTPSRHERIPPTCIVLMFNCFEASFDLAYGDISTLPESDTTELRSLTSGKSLGRVKTTPEKGASPQKLQQPSEPVSAADPELSSSYDCYPPRSHPIRSVSLAPGTPIEERVEFANEWKVGSEHGVVHDGLQADGYLELRMDWKAVRPHRPSQGPSAAALLLLLLAYAPLLMVPCSLSPLLSLARRRATTGLRTSPSCASTRGSRMARARERG